MSVQDPLPQELEGQIAKIARIVSIAAVTSMLFGFAASVARGVPADIAGVRGVPVAAFLAPQRLSLSLAAMCAGIILLSLLPGVSVLLACWRYMLGRDFGSFLIGLLVLIELCFGILTH